MRRSAALSKPMDEFAWRRRKRLQRDNMCRQCRSDYGKSHYEANKPRYIQNAARVKKATKLDRTWYLLEYFEEHPCADCGESDPVVLEFDHFATRSSTSARAFEERAWDSVLEEIEKCEVVCANCHRVRTAAGWSRSLRYRISRGLDLRRRERVTGLEPVASTLEGSHAASYTSPAWRPNIAPR